MLSTTELRKDTLIELGGNPYKVIEYSHKQLGRGGSIVNTKLKNLIDGSVQSKTFKGSDKITPADIEIREAQYLYGDKSEYYFMNPISFDQYSLNSRIIGDSKNWLKEGLKVKLQEFKGQVINLDVPIKVSYTVIQADPGIKGDTVSNVTKTAQIETGAKLQVPLFIKVGNQIVVDTRTGSYVERS